MADAQSLSLSSPLQSKSKSSLRKNPRDTNTWRIDRVIDLIGKKRIVATLHEVLDCAKMKSDDGTRGCELGSEQNCGLLGAVVGIGGM